MKFFFGPFLSIVLFFNFAAQGASWDEGDRNENLIHHEGQILSVTISRGNPIRIFVIGKEEAQLNLKDVSLTLRRLKPYPGKVLKVDRYGGYFEVKNQSDFNQSTELEVSTRLKGQKESFKVQLKEKP